MPEYKENRKMPYTARQMYDLVADISAYPKFLPWCSAIRIRNRCVKNGCEVIEADLVVSFKVFRERFGSRVTLNPDAQRIDVEYLEGPFKYLTSYWQFAPTQSGCEVEYFVDFEFKSRVLQTLIGVVFNEAQRRIVRAFETRAMQLYGDQDVRS